MPDGFVTLVDPASGARKKVHYTGSKPTDEELADIADQVFPAKGATAAPRSSGGEVSPLSGAPVAIGKTPTGGSVTMQALPHADLPERDAQYIEGLKLAPTEQDVSDGGAFGKIAINGKPISPLARKIINGIVGIPLGLAQGAKEAVETGADMLRDTFSGGLGGGSAFQPRNVDRLEHIVKSFPFEHPIEEGVRGLLDRGYLKDEQAGHAWGRFKSALSEDWDRDPVGTVAQGALLGLGALGLRGRLSAAARRASNSTGGAAAGMASESLPSSPASPPASGLVGERLLTKAEDIAHFPGLSHAEKMEAISDLSRFAHDGSPISPSSVKALEEVFGPDFTKTLTPPSVPNGSPLSGPVAPDLIEGRLSASARRGSLARSALDLAGAPRGIMASFDLSAPGRQALPVTPYLLAKNPRGYALAWKEMLRSGAPGKFVKGQGEANYEAATAALRAHPDYEGAHAAGLDFAHVNGSEAGWGSKVAGKVPGVAMSERSFNAFMDRVRLETFSAMKESMEKGGSVASAADLSDVARFVNVATGRGEVGKLGQVLKPITDHGLFSAKNTAAKFQYLNPVRYVMMSSAARREALSAMLGHAAVVGTTLGVAAGAGAGVSLDPSKGDFGKIRLGDTRYEVSGGYALPIRFLLQSLGRLGDSELSNEQKAAEVSKLAAQYLRKSAAPVPGRISDAVFPSLAPPGSEDARAWDMFVPLLLQDLKSVVEAEGWGSAGKASPGVFGVGVQSYADRRGVR